METLTKLRDDIKVKVEIAEGEGRYKPKPNVLEWIKDVEKLGMNVCIIGVWGAGGIGKTTLVKNVNNELEQIDVSIRCKLCFGVVIWVTVPKPPIDIRKVQAQIADRLNVKVANRVDIEPLAMDIARECGGLPLAITIIATCMRGKSRVELWEDALKSLRMSEPYDTHVIQKVYKIIKLSLDNLESRNSELSSEQRSNMNKRRGDIQSCFLYCSLYPAAVPTDDLIHCWWVEGFLGEHDTYEKAYNRGITIIESLKDVSLLEAHEMDCVKMHDVVRDVAIWIDNFGLTDISHIEMSAPPVKRISLLSKEFQSLPENFRECPETTTLLLLLDCDNTRLHFLPQGMDKLTNLRLVNMPLDDLKESIGPGFFLELHRIEMLKMDGRKHHSVAVVGATPFDEISSLHNLTSLFIRLDSSSIFNRDYTWMSRLKSFHIQIGETSADVRFNKSTKRISVSHCETFSNGELSGMLQFASDLYLAKCGGLRKLIVNKKSFNGLKKLYIVKCWCDFGPLKEGSRQFDPLPNLEHLRLTSVDHLKSVSDFSQFLGLRFSELRQLDISHCDNLTCVFNAFSVTKHLEEITVKRCDRLVELLVQCGPNQRTPRVRKLWLNHLLRLEMFGEPQSMWEHLEVIGCYDIRKLPHSGMFFVWNESVSMG
uniref:Disease resistance protein n=1 Tax=Solanum tuberosum TaxID=4113 RepID=M0ZQH4_SOLTU